jgi:hypothetical protein
MALPAIGLGAAALLGGGTALGGIAGAVGQSEAGKAQERATKYAAEKAAEQKEREFALNAGLSLLGPELSFGRDLAFTGFEAFDPAARQVQSNRAMYNMIESGMSPDQVAWGRRMMGGFAGPNVAGKYRSQFMGA